MRHALPLLCTLALCALACERKSPDSAASPASTPQASAASGAPALRLGFIGSLTGPEAFFGQEVRDGVQFALDEANAAGGVLGHSVELVAYDSQGHVEQSVAAARRLVTKDKVLLILGDVSSAGTLAVADVAQPAQVPVITPTATHPSVTQKGDFIFRTCFIDSVQALAMARFARQQLKLQRVALLQDDGNPYSVGLAHHFSQAFTALGGQVVASQHYAAGDTDFRAALTQLKQARPQALYLPGFYSEVGLIARQARQLGLSATLLGADGWESQRLFELAGDSLEGSYHTAHCALDSPSPALQRFQRDFQARYGRPPEATAALGYDAARVALEALRHAQGRSGPTLRDAISLTRDFPGVLGSLTLDEKRNPTKPAFVVRIQGTSRRFAASLTP